ncbi:MAG: dihydropteroate synthase [Planctomycetota bacterium]
MLAHGRVVDLDRPRVVAIVNATPDSFYDGGVLRSLDDALNLCARAVADGAAMLDIGGESTRPGAHAVNPDEQIRRVRPIVEAIRSAGDAALADVPISVDTTSAAVARACIEAGADAANDVSGGTADPAMCSTVAELGAGLVLMHRRVRPERDRFSDAYEHDPAYEGGVVRMVAAALDECAADAITAGVPRGNIAIDPGLGFGKSVEQNMELLTGIAELAGRGFPVLVGASRKSFVGRVSLDRESDPAERLAGSIAATVLAARGGALLHRVHDAAPHVQALRLCRVAGRE